MFFLILVLCGEQSGQPSGVPSSTPLADGDGEGGEDKCEGGMLEGGSNAGKGPKKFPKKGASGVPPKKKSLLVMPLKLLKKRKKMQQACAIEPAVGSQKDVEEEVQVEDSNVSASVAEGGLGQGDEKTHEISFEVGSI